MKVFEAQNRMSMKIEHPVSYFEDLGGLHDARVEEIRWQKSAQKVSIFVDDANANFLGLPGHAVVASAFVFAGVEALDAELFDDSCLSIYDLVAEVKGSQLHISIGLAPFGRMSFVCTSVSVCQKDDPGL